MVMESRFGVSYNCGTVTRAALFRGEAPEVREGDYVIGARFVGEGLVPSLTTFISCWYTC